MSFSIEDLTMIDKIGGGSFGDVYLTKKEGFNQFFATKKVSNQIAMDERNRKYFNNEIFILKNIDHDNIIKLFEIKRSPNNFYLVFEFCNGGTLTNILVKYMNKYNRPPCEEECKFIIKQIVNGLAYLNRNNIIHRDLKLDNILVCFDTDEDKEKVNIMKCKIKIIDFGFARYLKQNELSDSILGSPMNMDLNMLGCIVNKNKKYDIEYDEKIDIWSFAIVCYNIFTGFNPFNAKDHNELYQKISNGYYKIPLSLKLSRKAISFLVSIMQNDSKNRLDMRQLVYHEFLVDDSKEPLNIKEIPGEYLEKGELELNCNIKEYNFLKTKFKENEKNFQKITPNDFITLDNNKYDSYDLFNFEINKCLETNSNINNINQVNNINSLDNYDFSSNRNNQSKFKIYQI